MNVLTKTILWIYYFISSLVLSIILLLSIFIQNFFQIMLGTKLDFLITINLKLIKQISKINFSTSFEAIYNMKENKNFDTDPGKSYLNLLAVFMLLVMVPIYFATILLSVILNLVLRSKKLLFFIDNLIIETNKLFFVLMGYPIERIFYFSNFTKYYFIVASIPFYFLVSRLAFYGPFLFGSTTIGDFNYIIGNILSSFLTGLYILFIFPYLFGSPFHNNKIWTNDLVGVKSINLFGLISAILVILGFITIMNFTYSFFIPTIQIVYDSTNLLTYLSIAIIAGVVEEVYFRGMVLNYLLIENGKQKSPLIPIILSALLFGLAHSVNIIYGAPLIQIAFQIFDAVLFGLLIGFVYYKTGSLWPGILMHTAIDTYSFGFQFTYFGRQITSSNLLIIENIGWFLTFILLLTILLLFLNTVKPKLNQSMELSELV